MARALGLGRRASVLCHDNGIVRAVNWPLFTRAHTGSHPVNLVSQVWLSTHARAHSVAGCALPLTLSE
jgi:hypothetical protein